MYHNAEPAPLYLKDCVNVTEKTNAFRNAPAGEHLDATPGNYSLSS